MAAACSVSMDVQTKLLLAVTSGTFWSYEEHLFMISKEMYVVALRTSLRVSKGRKMTFIFMNLYTLVMCFNHLYVW